MGDTDYPNTRAVMQKLAETLKCIVCKNVTKNPHTVGGCGHFSCYDCLLSLKISQCPGCDQQFYPSDLVPDAVAKPVLNEWKLISSIIGFSTQKRVKKSAQDKNVDKLVVDNKSLAKSDLQENQSIIETTLLSNKSDIAPITSLEIKSKEIHENPNNIGKVTVKTEMKIDQNENLTSNKILNTFPDDITNFVRNSEENSRNEFHQQEDINNENNLINDFIKLDGAVKERMISNKLNGKSKNVHLVDESHKLKEVVNNYNGNKCESKTNDRKNVIAISCKNSVDNKQQVSELKTSDSDESFLGFESINGTPKRIKSTKRKSYSDYEKSKLHSGKIKKRTLSDDCNKKKVKFDNFDKDSQNDRTSSRVENESPVNSCDIIPATPQGDDIAKKNVKERRKSHSRDDSSHKSHSHNADKSHSNDKKGDTCRRQGKTEKSQSHYRRDRSNSVDDKNETSHSNDHKKRKSISPDGHTRRKSIDDSDMDDSKHLSSPSVRSTKKKKDIKKRNDKGETELQIACKKGNLDYVKNLLAEGADPNTKDYAGWTPLHEAVEIRNVALVETLLDAGAFVNVPGFYNITPLLEAVLKDNIVIARLLLQRGADINLRSSYNFLPVGCAQSEDMEKLMNIYKTQVVDTKKVDEFVFPMIEPSVLFGVLLDDKQIKSLNKFCKTFNVPYANSFRKEISHVIVNDNGTLVCPSDFSVLRAIVNGIAIVSFSWIESCLKENRLLKPDKWEIKGVVEYAVSEAPMRSRQCNAKLLPKLFDGLHVYLSNFWPKSEKLTKVIATDLLRDAGAILLNREPRPEAIPPDEATVMFHADIKGPMAVLSHVILYVAGPNEPQIRYDMKHIKTLSTKWLLNCIQSFSILDNVSF